VGATVVIAATHWAVRARRLRSTGWWPRWVRSWSDPILRPVKRRVLGAGGSPEDAPFWLAGATLLAGLALIMLVRWLMGIVLTLGAMRSAGPGAWLHFFISGATSLLMAAIVVRVIGSWLGAGRYKRWMRPFYFLTDWLVEPIRRRLPPMRAIDLSPVAAYLVLFLLREILLSALR